MFQLRKETETLWNVQIYKYHKRFLNSRGNKVAKQMFETKNRYTD